MRRAHLVIAALAGFVVASAWCWWLCQSNPAINYLPLHSPAQWIVYPKPPLPYLQARAELPVVFRRSFFLEQEPPASATLSLRACKRLALEINGTSFRGIDARPQTNW